MTKGKSLIPISQEFVVAVRQIIQNGRRQAYSAANAISLAENLRKEYGSSYNKRKLDYFRKFYLQ